MADRKRLSETDESAGTNSKKIKLIQTTGTSTRPLCKYGAKCYRKHPDHLRAYRHPSIDEKEEEEDEEDDESPTSTSPVTSPVKQTTIPSNSTISLMELAELDGEKLLSHLYQMEFPSDLYEFWKFCSTIDKKNPRGNEQININLSFN
jgi:hypothetical protein